MATQIRSANIANSSVLLAHVLDGAFTADSAGRAKFAAAFINTALIGDAQVTVAKIPDGEITNAKLVNNTITAAKIAAGTLTATELASDAVTNVKILNATIGAGKFAAGAIATADIAASAVTAAKADLTNDWNFSTGKLKVNGVIVPTAADISASASGLDAKDVVRVATTASLVGTYSSGAKTITITATNAGTIDGVLLAVGDRVLVKDGATILGGATAGSEKGIYTVTTAAASGVAMVLTRSSDADADPKVSQGMYCLVAEGTTNVDQGFICNTPNPITLGTTALSIVQFTGVADILAGTALTKSGNTLSVSPSGITTTELNNGSVTLAKRERRTSANIVIGQGAGSDVIEAALSGDVTMTAAGVVAIGASKVLTSMINASAVTTSKIAANAVGYDQIAAGAGAQGLAGRLGYDRVENVATTNTSATITLAGGVSDMDTVTCLVTHNGVVLRGGGDDYTASGTGVVLVSAPINGDRVSIYYRRTGNAG